jgi:hypothetical protein
VFAPGVNGYEIEPEAPASIRAVVTRMLAEQRHLEDIALANNRAARERYRAAAYIAAVRRIMLPRSSAESDTGYRRSA